jgi:hypothetical protein
VTRRFGKKCPIFQKVSQTVFKPKQFQNIYNKVPKHLPQTTFETLKTCSKPCFETDY